MAHLYLNDNKLIISVSSFISTENKHICTGYQVHIDLKYGCVSGRSNHSMMYISGPLEVVHDTKYTNRWLIYFYHKDINVAYIALPRNFNKKNQQQLIQILRDYHYEVDV